MDTLLKETVNATVNSRYPGMAPEGRRQLEEILVRREVEKGELLLKEGQVSHNIVLVGKGMLRQFYYKNGKDVTEHFSYEGCIVICIESTLKKEPTHLMIEALEDSVVYLLPYDKLMLLTEISWEINMFYRKILEYSLIVSQIKADSWRFETARERYSQLMEQQPEVIKPKSPKRNTHASMAISITCLMPKRFRKKGISRMQSVSDICDSEIRMLACCTPKVPAYSGILPKLLI